ncbi:hypothetical protein BSL78_06955 [Apostichopus japonicus]|uniref:Transmembrane protein n=1 Tax=Stichopus japonicus TaxID=307972 RepID=A0A2G8L7A3_STIJA|nr:hypothetical protein BSL78_06955 [Apostichopus japonicus]
MPAGAMPSRPVQALAPYVRQIGPFLIPCVVLTGYLMTKATIIGLREKRAKQAMGGDSVALQLKLNESHHLPRLAITLSSRSSLMKGPAAASLRLYRWWEDRSNSCNHFEVNFDLGSCAYRYNELLSLEIIQHEYFHVTGGAVLGSSWNFKHDFKLHSSFIWLWVVT